MVSFVVVVGAVVVVLGLFGSAEGQTIDVERDPVVTAVQYTDADGHELEGFLSLPETDGGEKELAAVIIIPDWDGANRYERQRANLLSDLGYVGFAADMFGLGFGDVAEMSQRLALMAPFRDDPGLFVTRIDAALKVMEEHPLVDPSKISVIGYCFGGTGVITYAQFGSNTPAALVSFHGGLANLGDIDVSAGERSAPLLVLSGGDDDTSTQVLDLEDRLDGVAITWEITRYSGILHGFTNVYDDRYNEFADEQSWHAMQRFLSEVLGTKDMGSSPPSTPNVSPVEYADGDVELRGYVSLPDSSLFQTPAPAVVILPDWDNVNEYEQQRATLLSEMGYVAFAADIYGKDLQGDLDFDTRVQQSSSYRSNPSVYIQRIQTAVDLVKGFEEVMEDKVSIIGYCFGGTGVIEFAVRGGGAGVVSVVSFHGGLTSLPPVAPEVEPYVLVLSGGEDDVRGNQTELEAALDAGKGMWELTHYSGVDHGFTNWGGTNYDARADERSWESMLQIFSQLMPISVVGGELQVKPARLFVEEGASGTTCSRRDACGSIQAAVDVADVGTIIVIGPGTFTENVVIPASLTGLHLIGRGSRRTIIESAGGNEGVFAPAGVEADVVLDIFAPSVAVKSMTIRHGASNPAVGKRKIGIFVKPSAPGAKIRSVVVERVVADVEDEDDLEPTQPGSRGVLVFRAALASIAKSSFVGPYEDHIHLPSTGTTVKRNTVDGASRIGIVIIQETPDSKNDDCKILRNTVTNSGTDGIQIQGDNNLIRNNIVGDSGGYGVRLCGPTEDDVVACVAPGTSAVAMGNSLRGTTYEGTNALGNWADFGEENKVKM